MGKKLFFIQKGPYWTKIHLCGVRLKFKDRTKELFYKTREIVRQELCAAGVPNEERLNRNNQINLSTALLHQKTFMPFKNKHAGQTLVITATGPTSKFYAPIPEGIHIGVNKAFALKNIPLDYYFSQDYVSFKEYAVEINKNLPASCVKFYGLTVEFDYAINRTIPESCALQDGALRYRTDWAEISGFTPRFAYDIASQPLGCFGTVVFPALQFALWTNPKRIYLVGCDCTHKGYFFSQEKNQLDLNLIVPAYAKFKDFAHKYYPETEIVSVNPVGLKGLFRDVYTRDYVAAHPELFPSGGDITYLEELSQEA